MIMRLSVWLLEDSSDTGLTEDRMILLLPSLRICSMASRLAPSPTDNIAMTLLTPKTTPSVVSSERIL